MSVKAISAVVVCAASLVSAIALAFALSSPVVPLDATPAVVATTPAATVLAPMVEPVVAPVVIAAPAPGPARHVARLTAPRAASQRTAIHCTGWRGLDQGSTELQVRSCD